MRLIQVNFIVNNAIRKFMGMLVVAWLSHLTKHSRYTQGRHKPIHAGFAAVALRQHPCCRGNACTRIPFIPQITQFVALLRTSAFQLLKL